MADCTQYIGLKVYGSGTGEINTAYLSAGQINGKTYWVGLNSETGYPRIIWQGNYYMIEPFAGYPSYYDSNYKLSIPNVGACPPTSTTERWGIIAGNFPGPYVVPLVDNRCTTPSITLTGLSVASYNGTYGKDINNYLSDPISEGGLYSSYTLNSGLTTFYLYPSMADGAEGYKYNWVITGEDNIYPRYVTEPVSLSALSNCPPTNFTSWQYLSAEGIIYRDNITPIYDPVNELYAPYATATESGSARFRRLYALGYV